MPKIVKLNDRIQYLQVSYDPLSADVVAVRGDSAWWIFDVGACDMAVDFINALPRNPANDDAVSLKKNIVISHFHRDHLLNVMRDLQGDVSLDFDAIYVGAYTSKTFGEIEGVVKNVVMEPVSFDDGVKIQILPIPNRKWRDVQTSNTCCSHVRRTLGNNARASRSNTCSSS